MKTRCIFLFCAIVLAGCESADRIQADIEGDVRAGNHELSGAPGIVPADAGLLDIAQDEASVWQQYDAYYRTLDTRFAGESFLDNLKWLTIEHMVRFSNFADADQDIHRYYLDEIMRRTFINNPGVALTVLDQTTGMSQTERARYCYDALLINNARLDRDSSYEARHQVTYAEAYARLMACADDLLGQSGNVEK